MESPESVVERAFRAVAERRYHAIAECVDPTDLQNMYERAVASGVHIEEAISYTADDFLRDQPDLPVAVAEYYARQTSRNAAAGSYLPYEYAHVEKLDDIQSLTPEELLARWIQARDPLYQLARQALVRGRNLPSAVSELYSKYPIVRTVIGSVLESPDIAHVVYRIRWSDDDEGQPKVAVVCHLPAGWRMHFHDDFLGQSNWGMSLEPDESLD
jgi:hypothetical protein